MKKKDRIEQLEKKIKDMEEYKKEQDSKKKLLLSQVLGIIKDDISSIDIRCDVEVMEITQFDDLRVKRKPIANNYEINVSTIPKGDE